MKVRTLPGVSATRAATVLRGASAAFQNVRGGGYSGFDLYNEYIRRASDQVRMLGSVLPRVDMDRVMTTPHYWMLQSVDPGGKGPVLNFMMSLELDEKIRLLDEAADALAAQDQHYRPAQLVVVPDTNYLLHHPHNLEAIQWASLGAGKVSHLIVAIPILVVDELDKAKRRTDRIENGKESVRTRARTTLATLERWFENPTKTHHELPIEEMDVEVTLILDDPDRPRLPDADYEIIDNARSIKDLTGTRVLIATLDSGMRLRARAAGVEATGAQTDVPARS
jgi:rRNA-processing protein FCF1